MPSKEPCAGKQQVSLAKMMGLLSTALMFQTSLKRSMKLKISTSGRTSTTKIAPSKLRCVRLHQHKSRPRCPNSHFSLLNLPLPNTRLQLNILNSNFSRIRESNHLFRSKIEI